MQNLPQNTEQKGFAVAPLDAQDIAEELEGLGTISLDIVKMPSAGGLTFELPGENEDNPEIAKEITGVIVDHHAVNAYWAGKFDGKDEPPLCMSLDGKFGMSLKTGEQHSCQTCPFNQFGPNKEPKACKNMHRLYILREGDALPIMLNVPPSSLKNLKEYIAKRVILKRRKLSNVVTQITLKKAQSNGGITYSQAVFTKVGELTPEQVQSFAPITEMVKAIGRRYPEPEQDQEQEPQAPQEPLNPAAMHTKPGAFDEPQPGSQLDDIPFTDVDDLGL